MHIFNENQKKRHAAASGRFTLLLVEDSSDDAFFFKRIVKKSGFSGHLEHALDGSAATRYLASHEKQPPSLIFLDLKMPIMSGFEVLGWMKAKEFCRNIRTVVLSGSDDQSDRERAASLGASAYLVKPITPEMVEAQFENLNAGMEEASPEKERH